MHQATGTRTRIWIMDGHNMIFAIPALQRLQVSDRREEARARLAETLERFATGRGEKVLLVFDGNQVQANPDAVRRPLFQVTFTRRGEGVADDRIIHEARACFERGLQVTVVTNDVSTLARNLPHGVRHLGVDAFWCRHIEKRRPGEDDDEDDKRVPGDISDLEREMLAQAAQAEPAPPRYGPFPPAAGTGRGAVASSGPAAAAGAPGDRAVPDRTRLKRERGRLRQTRRLGRYEPASRRR